MKVCTCSISSSLKLSYTLYLKLKPLINNQIYRTLVYVWILGITYFFVNFI